MRETKLNYVGADNGNCRVYYKSAKTKSLFCFQVSGSPNVETPSFEFLLCSRDGEPECGGNLRAFGNVDLPEGNERIDAQLGAFMCSPAWTALVENC